MVHGRRNVSLAQSDGWVFNRIADPYVARPPYPTTLVDAIANLSERAPLADIGAGIGHFARPLAARGKDVIAIDAARAMLDQLERQAKSEGLSLRSVHARAEALPFEARSLGFALIADALHFMDAELTGRELGRVLAGPSGLGIVTVELSPHPFMRALSDVMQRRAPRRPREMSRAIAQIFALAKVPLTLRRTYDDETQVDERQLEQILQSISYIGPAMNPALFAAFREEVMAIPKPRIWGRRFTLHAGVRRR